MFYTGAPQNTRRKEISELNIDPAWEYMKDAAGSRFLSHNLLVFGKRFPLYRYGDGSDRDNKAQSQYSEAYQGRRAEDVLKAMA